MPSEPMEQEAPPPRGWPPGFGRGEDERRALLTLSELRSLRPLALHREAWEVGTATGCVTSVRRGRLGSHGDRERLATVEPGRTEGRVEAAGAIVVTPADPGYDDRLNDLRDPPACLFRRDRRRPPVLPGRP
jgi:predicted Rossmann fold nucleotide-binding protein DprA/Smf involved in DNA uptake